MSHMPHADADTWPDIPLEAWIDTCATLHRWLQIVGKVRLVQSPWVNHSWNATLYVTARGLTTSPIPHGSRAFEIEFDFIDHRLRLSASEGATSGFTLEPQTVAAFHAMLMGELDRLGLPVRIHGKPNEVIDAIPFDRDEVHAAYDAAAANRFWRALVQADRVLKAFRARFIGKCSPVHYYWGAPDLAVARFSGRRRPAVTGSRRHAARLPSVDVPSSEMSY